MSVTNVIARNFDQAAFSYDEAASVQAQIAQHLMQKAAQRVRLPANILDIGCGTGIVAEIATAQWPIAKVTAIDHAPAMLAQAALKVPGLNPITADAAALTFEPEFDLILSSLALHWLPDPAGALAEWKKWLKPGGHLFAALLIEGSFQEWRDLCASENLADGLWKFPSLDFAGNVERQKIIVDYPSARAFLKRLKATGAATPHPNHKPFHAGTMRKLLACAPKPFPVAYQVAYIELP